MSGAADAALQGDVLSAMKGSKEDDDLYPPHHRDLWERAHQIAQMVGMPAKLCWQFLEVADRYASDMAAELVMTYGIRHVGGLEREENEEKKVETSERSGGGSELISDE